MSVNEYYRDAFERDLSLVVGNQVPRYFGANWRTGRCVELDSITETFRPYFVACLYYSVVIDQGLCHHLHDRYVRSGLFNGYPKFSNGQGSGHRNPREILRYPCVHGRLDHDRLLALAKPAAQFFVPETAETIRRFFPGTDVGQFFYLWTGFPEMYYWSQRISRRFPREVPVEQAFFLQLQEAVYDWGRGGSVAK